MDDLDERPTMDKTSHEPSLREVAAWLGQPQERQDGPPEWAGLDEEIRALPPEGGRELLHRALYLRSVGVVVTRENAERMISDARLVGERTQRREAEMDMRATVATVYYVRIGSLIKIGQTADVTNRLRAYPPDSMLLATEVGERDTLEAARHRQFRDTRVGHHRREWFHPSAALIEHINSLRDEPLTAAELAA